MRKLFSPRGGYRRCGRRVFGSVAGHGDDPIGGSRRQAIRAVGRDCRDPRSAEGGRGGPSWPERGDPGALWRGRTAGKLCRAGSKLIGVQVWDPRSQRLGTINDIVIDYRDGCPVLMAAVTPEISGMAGGYVFVPLNAGLLRFDNRLGRDYFALDMGIDQFRNAPRIERNNWKSIQDPQFLTRTRQFYERTERSAARPVRPTEPSGGFERGRNREAIPAPGNERGRSPFIETPRERPNTGQSDNAPSRREMARGEDNRIATPSRPRPRAAGRQKSEFLDNGTQRRRVASAPTLARIADRCPALGQRQWLFA